MSISKSDSIEFLRAALLEGENSGLSDKTPKDIAAEVKRELERNGRLKKAITEGLNSDSVGE